MVKAFKLWLGQFVQAGPIRTAPCFLGTTCYTNNNKKKKRRLLRGDLIEVFKLLKGFEDVDSQTFFTLKVQEDMHVRFTNPRFTRI